MRRLSTIVLIVMLVSAAALTGCGGQQEKSGADKTSAGKESAGGSGAKAAEKTTGETEASTLLTPADVEKVSGLSGLKVVPYDPSIGAGGTINIAKADGQLVAMLSDQGPDTWQAWSTDGITFREPYSPTVGDESYIGPTAKTMPAIYIFAFRKGDRAIVIDTYFDPATGKTILTVDQLHELAVIVESRL